MKRFVSAPFIILFLLFFISISSCTKEIVRETVIKKDSVTVEKIDELKRSKDLHYGIWVFYQHEIESYTGQIMTNKQVEKFTNYTVEWKKDGTYIQNRNGMLQTGTWDLISPSVFVYDKGDAVNERYYYVIRLDTNYYYRRGPFNKNGGLHRDYLATEYYHK